MYLSPSIWDELTKCILWKKLSPLTLEQEALKNYREKRNGKLIDESSMNQLGYALINLKRIDDAILIFEQNTVDYPQSWNVWDSLAEAYMDKGDKQQAIADYEKSLQLNPGNTNGAEQLKKLKSN